MYSQLPRVIMFLSLACIVLMSGCAETHTPLHYIDTASAPSRIDTASAASKVWPGPPEVPRYRYVGELTGEQNFRAKDTATRSTLLKVFDWLVGLAGGNPDKVVLQRPQCGTVDQDGRVYVTDVSHKAVYVFDKPAGKLRVWDMAREGTRFEDPIGIALGPRGEILVADAELHAVFRLDREGHPIGEFGRDVLKHPTGLARDAQRGWVYVADTYAHDIKIFSDSGKLLKVIGRRGKADGEFNFPTYLSFTGNRLYVTDAMNTRIQIFDADGKWLAKFGKRGLFVGNLVRPKGVAADKEGNIYVVESLYDTLLVFSRQGRLLLSLRGSGKEPGKFYLPAGVWTDSHDRIYVADMFNGRVVILQFLGDRG